MQQVPDLWYLRRIVRGDGNSNRFFLMYLFTDRAVAIEFLQDVSLLRNQMLCNTWDQDMSWTSDSSVCEGFRWRCKKRVAGTKTILFTIRWSSGTHLPIRNKFNGYLRLYPLTPRKNKYLLNFMCNFSKYAEAIPIPEMTAQASATVYATQIFARHGTGSILVTDQGRSFMSAFFKETCRILGVKNLNSSAFHPQSNGVVERFPKTMHQGSSHYVNACGINWIL